MIIKTVGLPRMHKEKGEKRDFLPGFLKKLANYPVEVVLEEGYGSDMDYSPQEYLDTNPGARFGKMEEAFAQDLVIVLRAPDDGIDLMRDGTVLMSMLHYETRPLRISKLEEKNITGLALDSITDDNNERIVENIAGTSWNGMKIAFQELGKNLPGFHNKKRDYLTVSIIGMGAVGMHGAKAARKFGDVNLYNSMEHKKTPGVLVQFFPRSITRDKNILAGLMENTDILADASKRYDPTLPIVTNDLIGLLPEHAVILDLTADPYDFSLSPIQVKGIEGIPTGNLDQYVFYPRDEIYVELSRYISTCNRRTVVSCNAWPGITPVRCMEIYGERISPFFPVLFSKDPGKLSPESDNFSERALARSTIQYFRDHILTLQEV